MENYDMMHYLDMKNESNDSSYMDEDSSNPVYMITTSTQTLPCPTRKIKPIKHPGLVLKTPIAYHSNTDPSVIPIQKDGIGKFVFFLLPYFILQISDYNSFSVCYFNLKINISTEVYYYKNLKKIDVCG